MARTKKRPAQEGSQPEGQSVTDQLREAIKQSGESLNQLAGRTGVDRARLSRFVRGERGLSLAAVDELCRVLGLRLAGDVFRDVAPTREAKRKPRKKKGKAE